MTAPQTDVHRLLFEHAGHMVCTLDLEGRITALNRAGEQLTGYTEQELLGVPATALIAPEVRHQAVEQFAHRLSGNPGEPDESVLLTRDGRRVPIAVFSAVFTENGESAGVFGVVSDLSERERAASALHESEQRFEALLEAAPDAVVITDSQGLIVLVNAQTEYLFGYSRAELLGESAELLMSQALRAARAGALGGGAASSLELAGRKRDGREFPIDVRVSPIETDDGTLVLATVRDASERKSAEEALLRSERRFRTSYESAPIGMALVGTDGRFLDVNQSLAESVGYEREELVTKTFQELTHPDDLELDLEYVRQMLDGEIQTYQMEKRYFHRLGHVVWVLLSVSLVRAGDGTPLHFVSLIQDITDRKRARDEIERRERQLVEAQQIARLGSWEYDTSSEAVTGSDELFRIFDIDDDEADLREAILERVHPEDRALLDEALVRVGNDREAVSLEYRVVLRDGSVRWIHGRGNHLTAEDEPAILRGTVQDITERKEAEEGLAKASQRYQTLVEQLPLGTYIRPLDLSKPNMYVSPQVEPMLGYPVDAWLTDPTLLAKIAHPDDRERILGGATDVRSSGDALHDEYRFIAPDGRVVWVQDETYVVKDEHGEPAYVQGFLLDITQRKLAEADRDRLRDELHHSQKLDAIGRLAGGVAHDFNNMLTAIRGYSELLLDGLGPTSPLRNEAEQISRAVEQASALPKQLLAFSRRQPLEHTVVDLDRIVDETSDLLSRLVSDRVELVTSPYASAPNVLADASQLEQILLNLAVNAGHAMPYGGRLEIATHNAEIGPELAAEHDAAPGRYVVLSVTDTGTGMDAETKARAFEPFFTTKARGEGSGLGLATVHGVVKQSGGFIRLESEPGEGTTFELHFPCAERLRAVVEAAEPPAPVAAATVLVAEDEEIVRELVEMTLERAGYRVLLARNGEEALGLLDDSDVELLVTDMAMPGVGGGELAECFLAKRPGIPIVFMSGYTEEPIPVGPDGQPAGRFLQKPFPKEELVRLVQEALGAGRAESAQGDGPSLTQRERQVLGLVADGLTNDRAAVELGISAETVQSHVRNAMTKLGAASRTHAVATALRLSLIG